MLILNCILGQLDEPQFAGRLTDHIRVTSADAGRRRMRVRSVQGEDVAIDLPRQSWLFDGAVLHDDGHRLLVAVRISEPVMVIVLAHMTPEAAFRIGHALGNRHSPSEVRDNEIVVPITDTPELTARPVLALGLPELVLRFEDAQFAAKAAPTCAGAVHEHPPALPHHHHPYHEHDHQH